MTAGCYIILMYTTCPFLWKWQVFFNKIDVDQKDIFERLRQTCLIKIQLMQKHPWIFDFIRIVVFTDSEVVKKELNERSKKVEASIFERFYGDIDTSRFLNDLDVKKAKQLIYWAVNGYAGEILEQFRSKDAPAYNFEKIRVEFDGYLTELRKAYYK